MADKIYYVWNITRGRWTDAFGTIYPHTSQGFTWEKAVQEKDRLNNNLTAKRNGFSFEVRELLPDGSSAPPHKMAKDLAINTSIPHVGIGAAINDHTCPTCGNTKCSRGEKTCWKCGNPL